MNQNSLQALDYASLLVTKKILTRDNSFKTTANTAPTCPG